MQVKYKSPVRLTASALVFCLAASAQVSFVTLNMAKVTDTTEILKELRAVAELRSPDIFLMQEVKEVPPLPSIAEQIASAMGMHVKYAPAKVGVADQGLAVLSRYPLENIRIVVLKEFNLAFHSRSRIAISATIQTPIGPVRISNAHLDTRINGPDRVEQLAAVVHERDGFDGPRLIAGDFNTNNFYWLGHVVPIPAPHAQTSTVVEFMQTAGFRSLIPERVTTFDYLGMHLDWIFSNRLEAPRLKVIPLDFSDHHAVWAELRPAR